MRKKIPDNWVRNSDGSYDIHGHVSYGELPNLNWVIRDGRFTVRFRNVYGSFNCEMCGLTTLKGGPKYVAGGFECNYNYLKNLLWAPKYAESLSCNYNQLNTLRGAPKKLIGNFLCIGNNLKTLRYAPTEVLGQFSCSENPLTDLIHCPKYIGLNFTCCNTRIRDFTWVPEILPQKVNISSDTIPNIAKRCTRIQAHMLPLLKSSDPRIRIQLGNKLYVNWSGFKRSIWEFRNWIPKSNDIYHTNMTKEQASELRKVHILSI